MSYPTYITFLFILFLPMIFGLIGYDCGGGTLNITTLSLLDPLECNVIESKPKIEKTYIQLLQLSEFKKTEVYQCRIEIDRTVYYCGMHSHISITENGRRSYVAEITRDACVQLQQFGTITLGNNKHISNVQRNSTTRRELTLAGMLKEDGTCEGEYYNDGYGQWTNAVVQATLKITTSTSFATVRLNNNKIILKGGTYCNLQSGQYFDDEGGWSFWSNAPSTNCELDGYDVLYQGTVSKVQEKHGRHPDIYSLTSDNVIFSLMKTFELNICGYTIIKTEHPKLFIFETILGKPIKRKTALDVKNMDIFIYINSKFIYVERHIKTQITELYKDIMLHKCQLERQVLKNALAIATISPDEFTYNLMKGPGYMANVAGEVVHIVKCIPVECQIRSTKECYSELPVLMGNASLFISPKSKIIVTTGTQKECSPFLATMYKIDDIWYRFTPGPVEVAPPKQLAPDTQMTWKYVNPGPLGTNGIYTQEDLENLKDHLMFPAEKPAVLDAIARGMTGHDIQGNTISLMKLLDENSLNKIAETTGKRIWNGFITFGSLSAGVMGIFIIMRLIKFLVDTFIHGYTLHTIYGWSIHLLGALWSSITHLLIQLGRQRTDNKTKPEDPEQGKTETLLQEDTSRTNSMPTPTIEELHERLRKQTTSLSVSFDNRGGGVTSSPLPSAPHTFQTRPH